MGRPGLLGGEGECGGAVVLSREEELVERFDFRANFERKIVAAETDDVEAAELILSVSHAVGGNVLRDGGVALDDGKIPDVNELVEAAAAAEEDLIPDVDMAGEEDVIREDIFVTEDDVVGEVDSSHEKIFVTDAGGRVGFGAAMDGDVFANLVLFADDDVGFGLGVEREILGICAENAAPADGSSCADVGVCADRDVGVDADVFSNFRAVFDDGVGADGDRVGELSERRNDGGGVDGWGHGGGRAREIFLLKVWGNCDWLRGS